MEQWKTIEPNQWKPTQEGDFIVGILLDKIPEDKTRDISARYMVDTGAELKIVWGCTVLDDRMKYVNTGQRIKITFVGKTKNKKNQDVKIYKVEVDLYVEPSQF